MGRTCNTVKLLSDHLLNKKEVQILQHSRRVGLRPNISTRYEKEEVDMIYDKKAYLTQVHYELNEDGMPLRRTENLSGK